MKKTIEYYQEVMNEYEMMKSNKESHELIKEWLNTKLSKKEMDFLLINGAHNFKQYINNKFRLKEKREMYK